MKKFEIIGDKGQIVVGKNTFAVFQVADALAHGEPFDDNGHTHTAPATAAAVLARFPGLGDEETVEAIRGELARLRG